MRDVLGRTDRIYETRTLVTSTTSTTTTKTRGRRGPRARVSRGTTRFGFNKKRTEISRDDDAFSCQLVLTKTTVPPNQPRKSQSPCAARR